MVKSTLKWVVVVFCLFSSMSSGAMGIFWQPQERDLQVDKQAWAALMQDIKNQGFEQLILQWSRYGDSFSSAEQMDALEEKVLIAADNGLQPVLGLYFDPEFYSLQKQPVRALESYLRKLRSKDIEQALHWQERLGPLISGWYVSAEIDDENWREASRQEALLQWLDEIITELHLIDDNPVYISTFFTGKMAPAAYERLLSKIRASGYHIWVQDGAGVAVLTKENRSLYLEQVLACTPGIAKPASGVVIELFDVLTDAPFTAKPKPEVVIDQLINQKSDCDAERLFFSLRYLPAAKGVLEID